MTAAEPTTNLPESVRQLISESLAVAVDRVTLQASLMQDLGADSLDFLDIVFMLERAYGIQITRGELEQAARGDMSEDEFAPQGVISEAGLARLRELMPEAAPHIQAGLRPAQIMGLFTVQTFVHMVERKLNA